MVAPVLNDYEFCYTDAGVVLNTAVASSFIDVLKLSGLDSPEVRSTEEEYSGGHGAYLDARYFRQRTITIEGESYSSATALHDYLDDLKANYFPTATPQPFYFKLPGLAQRLLYCKSMGFKYDIDTQARIGCLPMQCQLIAEDPRIYTSVAQQVSTGLPTGGVGRSYNRVYNMAYGSSGAGGTVNLTNDGNFVDGGPATIVLTGDIVNPYIELVGSGLYLDFSLTVVNGQTLTIDLLNRSILLDGVSRRNTLVAGSKWFMIPPGSSTINFQADSYAANANMAVTFRPAWV